VELSEEIMQEILQMDPVIRKAHEKMQLLVQYPEFRRNYYLREMALSEK
jgi:hypothetical protein